jgi:hypothetical protein
MQIALKRREKIRSSATPAYMPSVTTATHGYLGKSIHPSPYSPQRDGLIMSSPNVQKRSMSDADFFYAISELYWVRRLGPDRGTSSGAP